MSKSLLSVNKFLKTFGAWWLIWASLQAVTTHWLGTNWNIAITDSTVFNALLSGSCLLIAYVMQFYLPQKQKYWYIAVISLIAASLVVVVSQLILKQLERDAAYLNLLNQSWPIRAGIAFLLSACIGMAGMVYYTLEDQKENDERKHATEKLSKEAELFNLRQQLQPHFLFNSLNSISALAGSKPEEARKMIQQLSDFLRGTIRKDGNQLITLDEELKQLQLYLDIEKVRFGHRLETEINCSESLRLLKIPALLLQPVVENAIKFGLYDTLEKVTITLTAERDNSLLKITVTNPFDSSTPFPAKGTGFGLNAVRRRLDLLFARTDLVSTAQNENIFITTIKIPQG